MPTRSNFGISKSIDVMIQNINVMIQTIDVIIQTIDVKFKLLTSSCVTSALDCSEQIIFYGITSMPSTKEGVIEGRVQLTKQGVLPHLGQIFLVLNLEKFKRDLSCEQRLFKT